MESQEIDVADFLAKLNLQPPPTKATVNGQPSTPKLTKSPNVGKPSPNTTSSSRSSIDFGPFVEYNARDGLLSVHLQDRSINDQVVKQLVAWIEKRIQKWKLQQSSDVDNNNSPTKPKPSPKKKAKVLRTSLVLYENDISDEGVQILSEFILLHTESVKIKHLKLWKNKITDIGANCIANLIQQCPYAIQEIHLSHNRITTDGAKAILSKVYANDLYPRQSQNQTFPLWLRLEFNFINYDEIVKYLNGLQANLYCLARDRNKCGPSSCHRISKNSGGTVCKVHLYVFDLQYKEVEQSTKLIQTKKKIQQIKDKKKTNNVDSIMSPEALKDLPEISTQVPTYIFLDTCAVLNMIDYYTPRDNLHVAKTFTLKNLIEKAKQSQFGESFENDGDKVYLIITDTVMQEIDHQKKASPALRASIVKYLQSEDSYINQAIHLNFLECLGSHQGEVLLKHQSQESILAVKHLENKNLQNDIMLINLALFWNAEIGETGNVIVISADKDVTRRAKLHNLPAEQLHVLDQSISQLSNEMAWTAAVIKQCIPNAYKQGGKPIGSPIQSKSIYTEFQSAINTTSALLAENAQLKDIFQQINKKALLIKNTMESNAEMQAFVEDIIQLSQEPLAMDSETVAANIQQWETLIAQKPSILVPKENYTKDYSTFSPSPKKSKHKKKTPKKTPTQELTGNLE